MARAKVKSLPSLSFPFCFSITSSPPPEAVRAAASETLAEPVASPTRSEGCGTLTPSRVSLS